MEDAIKKEASKFIDAKMGELSDSMDEFREQMAGVTEKLTNFASKFNELSEEDKAKLVDSLKSVIKTNDLLGSTYIKFALAFLLILCVFVFFGYKLYNSLVEKERKREEKKKQKQQKKKK